MSRQRVTAALQLGEGDSAHFSPGMVLGLSARGAPTAESPWYAWWRRERWIVVAVHRVIDQIELVKARWSWLRWRWV